MRPHDREELIRLLQQGEELSPEWARIIFPPDRREYELVYHGKERESEVLANTLAVPLQAVRTLGSLPKGADSWHNMLIFGDNLQVMRSLVDMKRAGRLCSSDGTPGVRAVYIDPPFATMQEFRGKDREQLAYQDKVTGAAFVEFMRRRLILLRELMAEDSTIYVHLDTKKSHYVKVVLDEIFDESHFANEIIWKRTNARKTTGKWPRLHDTILVYTKGAGAPFTPQIVKAEQKKPPHTLITWKDGLKYKTHELTGPGPTKDGESGRPWRGFDPTPLGRHWARTHAELNDLVKRDLIHFPSDGGFPRRRAEEPFDPAAQTVMVGDVWTDINRINQAADERLGYPTQKPEELIARILAASTKEGDLVLDAFAGSGTTCAAAEKMLRRWIAIDCGKLAIYTIQKRLLSLRSAIGNKGGRELTPRPFTLFNAGLYDFTKLRDLPPVNSLENRLLFVGPVG